MKTMEPLSFTFPKEMVEEIQDLAKEERKTNSQLVRDAVTSYVQEKKWRNLQRKAALKARVLGISSEQDIDRLVHQYRRNKI